MRIIDNKYDFYDYLQDYNDTLVFDRRNSFMLTKDIVCRNADIGFHRVNSAYRFILMQIGVTYWLILANFKKNSDCVGNRYSCYELELLYKWKNCNKPITDNPICLAFVDFENDYIFLDDNYDYSADKIRSGVERLVEFIDRDDFNINWYLDTRIKTGDDYFDIPILAPSGIGDCVNPEDVFYAIEEYFSLKKSASEKTVAEGTTNNDKITAHGFDVKTSFRGK